VSCPSPKLLLHPVYHSLKEDARLLGFDFWLFGCGRLLEVKIAGARLLKGENEWLKGGLLKGKELLKLKREHGSV
jgi:hypothetical protein